MVLPPENVLTFPRCFSRARSALLLVTLSAMTPERFWIVVAMTSLIAELAKAMLDSPNWVERSCFYTVIGVPGFLAPSE